MTESWQSLRSKYVSWLKELEATSEKSSKLGLSVCNRCGFCCARRPCMPTPDEVKNIANYLGLTVKEAVRKYFVADRFHGSNTSFIFPAKETQKDITGTFIDWRRTYDEGYCIFYDKQNKACRIHDVRPYNAKITNCWDHDNEELLNQETSERNALWDKVNLEDFGIDKGGLELV